MLACNEPVDTVVYFEEYNYILNLWGEKIRLHVASLYVACKNVRRIWPMIITFPKLQAVFKCINKCQDFDAAVAKPPQMFQVSFHLRNHCLIVVINMFLCMSGKKAGVNGLAFGRAQLSQNRHPCLPWEPQSVCAVAPDRWYGLSKLTLVMILLT